MSNNYPIEEIYSNRANKFSVKKASLKKKLVLVSVFRLFSFLLFVFGIFLAARLGSAYAYALCIFALVAFALLIKGFVTLQRDIGILEELGQINQNEKSALQYDFSVFPETGECFVERGHNYSYDLDLFGKGSVFQLLNRTFSEGGKKLLADWLVENKTQNGDLYDRQKAVSELGGMLDWRQDFLAIGNLNTDKSHIDEIIEWLQSPRHLSSLGWLHIAKYLVPAVAVGSLILLILGLVPASAFITVFIVSLSISGLKIKTINKIHSELTKKGGALKNCVELIKMIEDTNFETVILKSLKAGLYTNKHSASQNVNSLVSLVNALDSRLNILVGIVLNGFLMWDINCALKLESWEKKFKDVVPVWFDILFRFDAYCSLANYRYNYPENSFPELHASKDGFFLEAVEIGHPLINTAQRVNNNFGIEGWGRFVIITGANMAGKSTFLRTIGINLVLAGMALPVCAKKFVFTPVKLFTSMRSSDSIQENESYFYAELKRLKQLQELIKNHKNVFVILDEILKGTNSVDKQKGSEIFLKQLVQLNATGLIATHDLALTKLADELPGSIGNMCFEIDIEGAKMSFDYLLREGITQKMNALLLMEQMGLITGTTA